MPKFDTASPQRIAATDYNAIRNKIINILGTGSGQQGYGQTLQSSAVFAGNNITKNQWDLLRYDIINARVHQDGVLPTIITLASGDVVGFGAGHPNENYDTLSEQAISNRFEIGAGQSVLSLASMTGETAPGIISRTGSWATQSQCTLTVSFATANEARYFFNSGGKIRFTSSRTGGTVSPQNTAWTNLLNTTVGTVNFSGNIPSATNFYTLTTAYQQFYNVSSTTPYSANFYKIEALCNCTDPTNVNGTASVVTFRVTWSDSYVDVDPTPPGDLVDGTLSLTVEEFKAAGALQPTGSFAITSPTYSISSITAT